MKKMMKIENKEIRRKRRIKYDFEKSLEKNNNKNIKEKKLKDK